MIRIEKEWVEFSFYRPGATSVQVAGDFNGWKAEDIAMAPLGDGNWKARLRLPAGEFRFRYCADGEWFTDYAACGLEPGRFGLDSILIVPTRALRVTTETTQSKKAIFVA